jgi:hypothetical protein
MRRTFSVRQLRGGQPLHPSSLLVEKTQSARMRWRSAVCSQCQQKDQKEMFLSLRRFAPGQSG